jgi:catechol 2,3-dioxygenase-like lactoylglutathione lyase family enzyme
MPRSVGFNHVATVTGDLDRVVAFYQTVFDAQVTLEVGGGAALNVAEQPPSTIVGDRTTAGSRGPIDHYGIAVASSGALSDVRDRLLAAGAHVGDIQRLGESWSLFFRDPDGMELEVCAPL